MQRRSGLLGAFLALTTLTAVGCGDSKTTVTISPDPGGINVTGRGEVTAEPDTGFFTVSVEVAGRTVVEARDGAAEIAQDVIDSLSENEVRAEDLQTTNLSIAPEYSYPRDGGQPTIVGYRVLTSVAVTVRNLDSFSEIVDDAISSGGDAVRLAGIQFDIEDTSALLEQARELAMKDARAKAQQLASLADAELGDPIAITETTSSQPPPVFSDKAVAEGGASIPVEPGTGTVVVTVNVRWAVR